MPPYRPVTLGLMIRRLAPFVGNGMIDFDEALDTVLEIAIERGRCDMTMTEVPWDRVSAIEEWTRRSLEREAVK